MENNNGSFRIEGLRAARIGLNLKSHEQGKGACLSGAMVRTLDPMHGMFLNCCEF